MPDPSPRPLPEGLPLPAPFFLRQFRAPDAWGDPATPTEDRIEDAISRGFDVTKPKQSLFRVADGDDLRRVVVGMCAGRQKPAKRPFHFVPFTEVELATAGIVPTHVAEDETGCFVASRALHFDAQTDGDTLRKLCRTAIAAGRPRVDVFPPALKELHATAAGEGCPACGNVTACRVDACRALTAPAAEPGAS